MTVGAGGVEVVLLDRIEHTDIHRSYIHSHRLCRIRDVHLVEGDDMFPQTVEDAEAHEFDVAFETREFYRHLAVLDVAGRDDLGDTGIFVVGIIETGDRDAVVACPVVKTIQYTL